MNLPVPPPLQTGDILLYGDASLLSWLIRTRTWSDVSHVEVYAGDGKSMAARTDGVGMYQLRLAGLRRVLRPVAPFDFNAGLSWFFKNADGKAYGWMDMWRFYGRNVETKGWICSEFTDYFFQAAGLPLFNTDYPEGAVCPRDYELLAPSLAKEIWSWK